MANWLKTYVKGQRPHAWEIFHEARMVFACGLTRVEDWVDGRTLVGGFDCMLCADGMLTEPQLHKFVASTRSRGLNVVDVIHYQQSEIIPGPTEMHLDSEELPLLAREENERPYCDLYILERAGGDRFCILFIAMDDYLAYDAIFANGFAPVPAVVVADSDSVSIELIGRISDRAGLSMPAVK